MRGKWSPRVKLEEVAALMFLLCLLVAAVSIFSIRFWDGIVQPVIELTGATVYTLRYPVLFAAALWGSFALFRRQRHR
jgi:hypothetical protein